MLDLKVVQVTPHQVRLELQRSEPERRHRPEVAAFEIRPRLGRIDRRQVEQQVHPALHPREPDVNIQRRRKPLSPRSHLTETPTNLYEPTLPTVLVFRLTLVDSP